MALDRALTTPPDRIVLGEETLLCAGDTDAGDLYAAIYASRDHLMPWMPWVPGQDRRATREYVTGSAVAWAKGEDFRYVVLDAHGATVGACGLHRRIGEGGFEIGYWTHVDHVGRGIATRAAGALVDAAFTLHGIDRIEIHHDEANVASSGVPRRLGFRHIASTPCEPEAPGCVGIEVVWRLTRAQWTASAG